jgi:predicted DNA-binding transcriptional regulator
MDLTQFYQPSLQLAEELVVETALQAPQVVLVVADITVTLVVLAQQIKVMQVQREQILVDRTVQAVVVALDKHLLNQLPVAVELAETEFQVV